ncbi:MAG: succinate dehydrogenase, hydrophobic membrane anchor protein [Emcibacter sp.]|nr:succinate dehydrogenase, hydrophobic membrane anchor protein [Emcibacter sp.]MBL4894130.1 succinate dehydrogenase, hydrophobic membrane anchor protein [Emcibacter sp.]
MDLNTPISKVRGLGSAKSGTEHWWMQKIAAVALIPLTIWFVASIVQMTQADYFTVKAWLSSPVSAILMLLYIVIGLYHLRLGLQAIVEDYIHAEGMKIFLQFSILFGCTIIAVASIFSVLKIAL